LKKIRWWVEEDKVEKKIKKINRRELDRWGPRLANGILTNDVIMTSNPCFQFLQPNIGRVDSNPKIRDAT
jgi:hypothetical protein